MKIKLFEQLIRDDSLLETKIQQTLEYLSNKENILFLTTSNRWEKEHTPKSTQLAYYFKEKLKNIKIIEVPELNIYPCEGNVSAEGNNCGVKESLLKNKYKNPTGYHRCWASINNKNDELWKISKEIFNSDTIILFGSVRWGSMNSYYQKLIERLTWLENRHTTLKESNILKNKKIGLIIFGHNWNGKEVLKTQKQVLECFGFTIEDEIFWNYQYIENSEDETKKGYIEDEKNFKNVIK